MDYTHIFSLGHSCMWKYAVNNVKEFHEDEFNIDWCGGLFDYRVCPTNGVVMLINTKFARVLDFEDLYFQNVPGAEKSILSRQPPIVCNKHTGFQMIHDWVGKRAYEDPTYLKNQYTEVKSKFDHLIDNMNNAADNDGNRILFCIGIALGQAHLIESVDNALKNWCKCDYTLLVGLFPSGMGLMIPEGWVPPIFAGWKTKGVFAHENVEEHINNLNISDKVIVTYITKNFRDKKEHLDLVYNDILDSPANTIYRVLKHEK